MISSPVEVEVPGIPKLRTCNGRKNCSESLWVRDVPTSVICDAGPRKYSFTAADCSLSFVSDGSSGISCTEGVISAHSSKNATATPPALINQVIFLASYMAQN